MTYRKSIIRNLNISFPENRIEHLIMPLVWSHMTQSIQPRPAGFNHVDLRFLHSISSIQYPRLHWSFCWQAVSSIENIENRTSSIRFLFWTIVSKWL